MLLEELWPHTCSTQGCHKPSPVKVSYLQDAGKSNVIKHGTPVCMCVYFKVTLMKIFKYSNFMVNFLKYIFILIFPSRHDCQDFYVNREHETSK